MIRVTIYNEFVQERKKDAVKAIYPEGIHTVLAEALACEDAEIRTVTLDDAEQVLTEDYLNRTDVLIWWSHVAHDKISDALALRIRDAVLRGMGFIALHSSHRSKPLQALLGTSGRLGWRESGDFCRMWVCAPSHPICRRLGSYIEIPHEETYTEAFDIPAPDEILFLSWYSGGEVFRSGCTWRRGMGKIFYFQPGHETYPVYYQPEVRQVLRNALRWAAPTARIDDLRCYKTPRLTNP